MQSSHQAIVQDQLLQLHVDILVMMTDMYESFRLDGSEVDIILSYHILTVTVNNI